MGTPYANQSANGYSSSPPPDDGSVTAANKVTYAKIKGQLGDPLKTYIDAVNSALRTALNVTPTSQSAAYTTTIADHLRPIEVTGTTTISLGDAATMVAQSMGYSVPIFNKGVATVTISRITGTDTLNGALKNITLAPGQGVICSVNSTSNGYEVIAESNGVLMDSTDPSKQARFDVSSITTGTTRLLTVQNGDAYVGVAAQTLTDGVTINWDVSAGIVASVTLGGNRTMAAPTNLKVGTYVLHVIQDATGSRTLNWNAVFKWQSATAPTLSTGAGKRDVFSFISDGTNLYGNAMLDVR